MSPHVYLANREDPLRVASQSGGWSSANTPLGAPCEEPHVPARLRCAPRLQIELEADRLEITQPRHARRY